MNNKWIAHLSKDEIARTEFSNFVKGAKPVLTRLIQILTKDLEASRCEQKKIDLYDCPNWQLMQSDCNATQRTLEKIIKLCNI